MKKIALLFSLCVGVVSTSFAVSLEGYWKSIDDRSGEALSLIEMKKMPNGKIGGVILYRYPTPDGIALTTCAKCPEPYTNKPLVGLQIASGFVQNEKKPLEYIHGKVLEAKTGKMYDGKGTLSPDGRRLKLRGFIGVSLLGRNQVWVRINDPQSEIRK